MSFRDCACHVWAIDGYHDDEQAHATDIRYVTLADDLLAHGRLGDKSDRVAQLVKKVRRAQASAGAKAIIYGGWQNDTDAAPEHMWLEYGDYIYDTMPDAPLRRKAANALSRLHPPSEFGNRGFDKSRVGSYATTLTVYQYAIITDPAATWRHRERDNREWEYMPQTAGR